MSSIVDALYEITYNPFEYGSYIASFYANLVESENNVLLAQLVIPLCSHPFFSLKLSAANTNSTIYTIFNGKTNLKTERDQEKYKSCILKPNQSEIAHRDLLYDLPERIDNFHFLTGQSIQYCLINDWLSVNDSNLSIRACDSSELIFQNKKSAEKLGRLFSAHSVLEIYSFLGVKPQ